MSWTYQHYVTSQLVLGWRSIFCWWPCHVGQQCQSVDVLLMGMLARSLVGSLSADYASIPRHVGIAGGPLSGLAAPGCLASGDGAGRSNIGGSTFCRTRCRYRKAKM